eukprot:scaffold11416_cov119-Isochrysis_galbana.AAC.11
MISASVEESAIHCCLLLEYEIGAPASRMTNPVVEWETDQSESTYADRAEPWEPSKVMPRVGVRTK